MNGRPESVGNCTALTPGIEVKYVTSYNFKNNIFFLNLILSDKSKIN